MLKIGSGKQMSEKVVDEPPSPSSTDTSIQNQQTDKENSNKKNGNGRGLFARLFSKQKTETNLLEVIEEAIENGDAEELTPTLLYEKNLISKIIEMRDYTAVDVMIPRPDIVAIDVESSTVELLKVITQSQHSKYPVFKDNLDNIIGTVHIKDLLPAFATGSKINIEKLCRSIPIISPAMPVHDILLQMQETRKHMVLVIDEYGGIDGMVAIGDIIETIVGSIDDEYDQEEEPAFSTTKEGHVIADAKVSIEEFENEFGEFLDEDERDELNTLAGVVFSLAGHVPVKGEILSHPSGVEFEVVEADQRRINRLKIRGL